MIADLDNQIFFDSLSSVIFPPSAKLKISKNEDTDSANLEQDTQESLEEQLDKFLNQE
jgi:hypothetical protein